MYPNPVLENKFNPENVAGMPAVKLNFCLELEEIFIL